MKKYISLFKIKFISNMQYRISAIAGIITQFVFGFAFVLVYVSFYESNINNSGVQLEKIVNYLWLNQAFYAVIVTWAKEKELLSLVTNGNICYELLRPISLYSKWFFTMLSRRLSAVILRCPFVLLIAVFLPKPYNLTLPYNFNYFILFLIALVIATLINVAFEMIYHLITFFTIESKGIIAIFCAIAEILSGGTVPIVFFPKLLKKIAYILPFRFISDYPFSLYSNIPVDKSIISLFIISIIWLIILIAIGYIISIRAVKKACVQGG